MRLTSLLLLCFSVPALAQSPFRVDLPTGLPDSFEVLVEHGGVPSLLRLERHSVRAEGFRLLAYRADGSTAEVPAPPPATYRGGLDGDPGSVVVACLTPLGLRAQVWPSEGESWSVEPLAGRRPGMPRQAHLSSGEAPEPFACEELMSPGGQVDPGPPSAPIDPDFLGWSPCMHEAELAYDADYEYYLRQGGTIAGTLANIEGHTAVVNEFYARDVQIQHRITTVIVRTAPFYFHTSGGHLLDLFQAEWNSTQAGVPRDMAHLMTDKGNLSGYAGLAYVGVVCNTAWAYGWSVDSAGVVGHELGHNWGAGHCHDPSPCNNMCGACTFIGPKTRDIIIAFRDSRACLDLVGPYEDEVPPYAYPDGITLTKNELAAAPPVLDVLANDDDGNCHPFTVVDLQTPTPAGAVLSLDPWHRLVYQPAQPHVGLDAFTYTVGDVSGLTSVGQVTVDVPARELEGAWLLDEGAGLEAGDASGYGHIGLLEGGPTWDSSSPWGGGLVLDGIDDRVRLPQLGLRGDEVTLATWLRRDGAQVDWAGLFMCRANGTQAGLHFGTGDELRYTWAADGGTTSWNSGLVPPDGQWVFVALVLRPQKAVLHLINGATHLKKTHQHGHGAQGFDGPSSLGLDPADLARRFRGGLGGVRVFDRALGASEVWDLAAFDGAAAGPGPRDGGALSAGGLRWLGSRGADRFQVYFGDDYKAVRDAGPGSPEHQGEVTDPSWDPGPLAQGKRWFWRVDSEIFPASLPGDVWQFELVPGHHWPLDETSGSVAADVGAGLDGAYEGGVLLGEPGATAKTGTSVFLDGDDDLVRVPPLELNDNHCTIAMWVKRGGVQDPGAGLVMSTDGNTFAGLHLGNVNDLRFFWNAKAASTNWDTGLSLPDGQWRFVALVVEPLRATVYLGDTAGNLSSATRVFAAGHAPEEFDGDTLFGEFDDSWDRAFRGWVDEVRFLPASLEPGQIEALYAASF